MHQYGGIASKMANEITAFALSPALSYSISPFMVSKKDPNIQRDL